MKKLNYFYLLFSVSALYILLSSYSNGVATQQNSDRTGSPGSSGLCSNCHSGGSFGTVTLSIQVFQLGTTNPVSEYAGGTTYDMRVTVNNSSGAPAGYGFQMTCLTTPGNSPLSGYTNLASNVKQKTVTTGTFTGRTYVEHNGVSASNTFNFRWTAPPTGTGAVRFYAAGNAVNGFGSSGDNAGNTSLTLNELIPLNVSGVKADVSCFNGNNGAINITVSGGTSPYTFNWSNGSNNEDLTNLTAGNYQVTVTDNSSATATASFTITQPAEALSISGTTSNVSCHNGNNGSITTTTTGGTPNYTYNWGGGITTPNRTNLTVGNYTVTVTDSKSCTASAAFQISQPTPVVVSSNIPPIACAGGTTTIQFAPSGGTPPYSISPGNFTVSAGNYTYTVTDANNCSVTTNVNVTQPTPLVANANNVTIPCGGGSATINVTASGGTSPYTGTGSFTITSPGTYNYTVTDNNGCTAIATAIAQSSTGLTSTPTIINTPCHGSCAGSITVSTLGGTPPYSYLWNNGNTTSSIDNLCPGDYFLTVTDNTGCLLTNSYIVTQPSELQNNISALPINCFGDTTLVTANTTGGSGPYSYSWSGNQGGSQILAVAGILSLTVTDANLCSVSSSITISQPSELVATTSTTNISCFGNNNGMAYVAVSGGTPPYFYLWSNGSLNDTIDNLAAGTYTLFVTDSKNCIAPDSVTITSPDSLQINLISVIPSGSSNSGAIDIGVTGGTSPYQFDWSNGSTTEDINQLAGGPYSVTVTDANNCTAVLANITVSVVSLENINELGWSVYPNPFSNKLVVYTSQSAVLTVYGLLGNVILIKDINEGINTIETTDWNTSQYIVEIKTPLSNKKRVIVKTSVN